MLKIKNEIELYNQSEGNNDLYVLQYKDRFWKVSYETYTLISLMPHAASEEELLSELKKHGISITKEEYTEFIQYLCSNNLLDGQEDKPSSKSITDMWAKLRILSPQVVRNRVPSFKHMWNPTCMGISAIFLLCWLLFCLSPENVRSCLAFLKDINIKDFFLCYFLFSAIALIHELGHVSALKAFGQSPGEIGIGIYVVFPAFYSDVNNANLLHDNKRAILDLAGIYFQLTISFLLFIINRWLKNNCLNFVCISSSLAALMNLLPFDKTDGYYFACDMLKTSHPISRALQAIKEPREVNDRKYRFLLYAFLVIYIICMTFLVAYIVILIPQSIQSIINGYRAAIINKNMVLSREVIISWVVDVAPLLIAVMFSIKSVIWITGFKKHSKRTNLK